MMRKFVMAAAAVALPLGLVAVVGGGVASARGGPPAPATATGSTTCNFHGTLATSPTMTVAIRGNLTPHRGPACTSQGGTRLRTGHLSGLASTGTITGLCSLVTGGPLPDVSGGSVMWSPRPKVAASTGVSLTGGSVSVVTVNGDTFLQIAYTGGSVASGSFTNASGASLTVTSRDDTATLTADCSSGPLDAIAFNGNLTL